MINSQNIIARLLKGYLFARWIKPPISDLSKRFQSFTFSSGEKAGMRASVKSNCIVPAKPEPSSCRSGERSRLGCRSVRLAPNSRIQLIATALMEMLKVYKGISKYIKVNKGGEVQMDAVSKCRSNNPAIELFSLSATKWGRGWGEVVLRVQGEIDLAFCPSREMNRGRRHNWFNISPGRTCQVSIREKVFLNAPLLLLQKKFCAITFP